MNISENMEDNVPKWLKEKCSSVYVHEEPKIFSPLESDIICMEKNIDGIYCIKLGIDVYI